MKNKQRVKIKTLELPIFKQKINRYICSKNEMNKINKKLNLSEIDEQTDACSWTKPVNKTWIMWCRYNSSLIHECSHITSDLMDYFNIHDDEFRSYFFEWIVKELK